MPRFVLFWTARYFAPIIVKGITPFIPSWKKPITIARHAYGDVYKNTEAAVPAGAKAELLITKADGSEEKHLIHDFKTSGIIQGMHNLDSSIESFARACFNFALDTKQDLWFATKDTISKNMTTVSRIFFRRSMTENTRKNSNRPA